MAARATFALKAGLCVRRARLAIVTPDMRHSRRSQADFPLIGLSEFAQPPLCFSGAGRRLLWAAASRTFQCYNCDRRRELSSAATSPTAHSGRPYGDPRWPSVRIAAPHRARARFRKPGQDAPDITGELRSSDWPALTHGVATDQVGYVACSTWSRKRM